MYTIDLAFVERGVHEELVAYVADQEGYYEDEGVHVAIRNGVSWDPERLRRGASIGLGRALLQRLTGGIGWKVLSVNTHRPLFWFLGNAEVISMADLRGRRVAVHHAHTAPGWFTRIILREHGLDPDRDLECVVRANNRALRTIAEQPDLAVDYIASFLNRLTRDEAQQYYERYIRSAFTPDGRVDLNTAQQGIDAVAAELGVAPAAADLIYAPSA